MNAATAASMLATSGRDPDELLDRVEIAKEFKIPVNTQIAWFNLNKYGWRNITIRVGVRHFARRRDINAWLESRKGVVDEDRTAKLRAARTAKSGAGQR